MARQDQIRAPRQERSQKRVAQILAAARVIIEEKGAATMKMHEIADQAGVSVGSIYQYFANKSAIVAALAEEILNHQTRENEKVLAERPQSLVQLCHVVMQLLDVYVELRINDPVVSDIWTGHNANKELQAIDFCDELRNRDVIFAAAKHLFREDAYDQAKRNLLILIRMASASVDLAMRHDTIEARAMIDATKNVLYAAWEATILPLGHKQ